MRPSKLPPALDPATARQTAAHPQYSAPSPLPDKPKHISNSPPHTRSYPHKVSAAATAPHTSSSSPTPAVRRPVRPAASSAARSLPLKPARITHSLPDYDA